MTQLALVPLRLDLRDAHADERGRDAFAFEPLASPYLEVADELVTLLAYEATRNVAVAPVEIETPVTTMTGTRLTNPKPMVVPILRAGLGMADGAGVTVAQTPQGVLTGVKEALTRHRVWDRFPTTGRLA